MATKKNKRKLIVSDLHLPFEHRGALKFCQETYKRFNCSSVISIGDIFDYHQMSRHVSEPDALGAMEEHRLTNKKLKAWGKAFPLMDIVQGNHDEIPKRQAKEVGIPAQFIRSPHEAYDNLSTGWTFHNKLVHEGVLYEHIAGSGMVAAMNKAKKMSMSTVCGHTHQNGGVIYFSNPTQLFFGLNVGCLIDKEAYAMRYSNSEPTLGVGVVVSSTEAHFVPMRLT